MSVIPALGRLRQEDLEFKASLVYSETNINQSINQSIINKGNKVGKCDVALVSLSGWGIGFEQKHKEKG
jgi:hypothetical protein